MTIDERTRLRLRQWFLEHMGDELADAVMEALPPVEWNQLATKDDLHQLEERLDAKWEGRFSDLRLTIVLSAVATAFSSWGLLLAALALG
jgi:hypothetical protein